MNEQIQALETELKEVQSKLVVIDQGGGDQSESRVLTDRKNEITNKLAELNEKEQAIEDKVQAEAVPFKVSGVSLDDVPVEIVQLVEAVVKADRRRIHTEHAAEIETLQQEIHRRGEESLIDATKIGNLEEDVADFRALLDGEMSKRHKLEFELHHAESKRDAAVAIIEEKDAEIARLKSELADYQKAKVYGEREAQGIVDITPEETNDIAAALESVKKLYTKTEDWGSVIKVVKPDGSFERIPRAELEAEWEPIKVPDMPANNGGSDDAATFLGPDQTTTDNGDTESAETPVASVGESFRTEESAAAGMAETASNVAGETVTREEFEAFKVEVNRKFAEIVGEEGEAA